MRSFKAGRFVQTPDGVGVVNSIDDWPTISVHLINDDGETTAEEKYDVGELKLTKDALPTRKAVVKKPL